MKDIKPLKPCPFCGSKKTVFHEYIHIVHLPNGYIEQYQSYVLECMGCGVQMNDKRVGTLGEAWDKRVGENG